MRGFGRLQGGRRGVMLFGDCQQCQISGSYDQEPPPLRRKTNRAAPPRRVPRSLTLLLLVLKIVNFLTMLATHGSGQLLAER